ncbi:GNAT family N-acetyltransferase [Yoonia sp. GPGPB17]|uniref:GNAT family N-acetyltransferase n=1 Tax=Yoonia sp. GPGPB17 TaxID=3026147 RepID=UPI0030C4742F
MTVPTLRTDRLILRAPAARDARVVTKALNNIAVSRWLTVVPFPYGMTDAKWFINECHRGRFVAWFIWAEDHFVGTIAADDGLGYWLAEDAWGKGYATEAAQAVVDHYFETTDADQLTSSCFDGNAASQHVLTKLGFVDAGAQLHFSKARNEEVPGRQMVLSRQRWQGQYDV